MSTIFGDQKTAEMFEEIDFVSSKAMSYTNCKIMEENRLETTEDIHPLISVKYFIKNCKYFNES